MRQHFNAKFNSTEDVKLAI